MMHKWTPEQIKLLDHYPDSTPERMEELFGGILNRRQIESKAKKLGIRKSYEYRLKRGFSADGRFVKGSLAWNAGINYDSVGRSILTRFKPGTVPPNHKPVGTIRQCSKDGYLYIKTEEGKYKFRLLHRENWKKAHGNYPPKGYALAFKDGDKTNCDISNLELVSRKELMQRNSIQNYPKEIKEVTRLRAVITRKINGN